MAAEQLNNEKDLKNDDGVLFWVNRGGFPIGEHVWNRMWNHSSKIHHDSNIIKRVRSSKDLQQVPIPHPPVVNSPNSDVFEKCDAIQNYMNQLQYNHTGTQFFEIKKNRPISSLVDSAKEIIKESLPIKCLEAVILSLYLTNGLTGLDRFTISFKSSFSGSVHRHVLLGLYHNGRYGALGISRRPDLMDKPIEYKSLSSMVLSYIEAYNKYWHTVVKVKIGLPIPHNPYSYEAINWKSLNLSVVEYNKDDFSREIDRHAREMKTQAKLALISENSLLADFISRKNQKLKKKQSKKKSPDEQSSTERTIDGAIYSSTASTSNALHKDKHQHFEMRI